MKKNYSVGLRKQLASYSSSAKAGTTLATLKQRLGNWSAYAAATGSVMAMATSASADIIRYTGGPVTVGVPPVGQGVASTGVPLASGKTFLFRIVTSNQGRTAFASAGAGLEVLHKSAGGLVLANLTHRQPISSKAGTFRTGHSTLKFVKSGGEWNSSGEPGFEGFRFATDGGNYDYGWAELELGVNGNGVLDSLTLLSLAYTNGPMIYPGQTSGSPSASPEPGTAGLMLLALGATGVTVLRHRRRGRKQQQAAQA